MAQRGLGLDRLGSPFPTYFAFVMATGIISIAARGLGYHRLGWALFGIDLFAYGIVWACGVIRLVHAPGSVWRELRHHETGPIFLTIVAGTGVLGSDAAAHLFPADFILALFSVAVLAWIFLIYCFLVVVIEGREKPPLETGLSGSWLLVVVSTTSLAILGSDVLDSIGQPPTLIFLCYFWLSLGWFYYVVLASVIFYRFVFVPMTPGEVAGPWWINAGAAAITVLAGSKLMELSGLALGSFQLRDLLSPVVTVFWADATFWIPLLTMLFAWKHLVRARPFRYSAELWSVAFPLGMYAAATEHFVVAFGLPFLVPVARVVFWVGLIVWLLSSLGMVRRIIPGLKEA